jgi:hypothetical protein
MKAEYIIVTFHIKQTQNSISLLFVLPSAVIAHMFLVETLRKSKPLSLQCKYFFWNLDVLLNKQDSKVFHEIYCNIFGVSLVIVSLVQLSLNNENKAFPRRVTMEADVTMDLVSVTRM